MKSITITWNPESWPFSGPPFLSLRLIRRQKKMIGTTVTPPAPSYGHSGSPQSFFYAKEPMKIMFSRVFEVADYDFACFASLQAFLTAHLISLVSSCLFFFLHNIDDVRPSMQFFLELFCPCRSFFLSNYSIFLSYF